MYEWDGTALGINAAACSCANSVARRIQSAVASESEGTGQNENMREIADVLTWICRRCTRAYRGLRGMYLPWEDIY